jgi:hypothetical protein
VEEETPDYRWRLVDVTCPGIRKALMGPWVWDYTEQELSEISEREGEELGAHVSMSTC